MEIKKIKPEVRLAKIAKALYYIGGVAAAFMIFNSIGNKELKVEVLLVGLFAAFIIIVLGFALVVLSEILAVLRSIEHKQQSNDDK